MTLSKLISILSGCFVAGSIATAVAGTPIKMEQAVHASELSAAPYRLTVSLYENEDDQDPVAVQTYYQDEWTTNPDLSNGIPDQDIEIKFAMQLDPTDHFKPGETLWIETSMDGAVVSERAVLTVPTNTALRIVNDGGVLFEGTFGNGAIPIEEAGVRMMWYPKKAALRAGFVDTTAWDDGNIGDYSMATGWNPTASGAYSTAMGNDTNASGYSSTAMGIETIASGYSSTAMGLETDASGRYATAMGSRTTASGYSSTAMGDSTIAQSYAETAIGSYNTLAPSPDPDVWQPHDRLFVIGNGEDTNDRSNAIVILKNGNTGIGDNLPQSKLHIATTNLSIDSSDLYEEEVVIEARDAVLGLYSDRSGEWGSGISFGEIDDEGSFTNKWAIVRNTSAPAWPVVQELRFTFGSNTNYATNNTLMKLDDHGHLSIDGSFFNTGADFAEYLPQSNPSEIIQPGDIVGIIDGQVSRNTTDATRLMVISEKPALLGNAPEEDADSKGLQPVAFIGQVDVRIWGKVQSGDYIIASGKGDGTGIAVNAEKLIEIDYPQIVGRAWASSDEQGQKKVKTVVGLEHNEGLLKRLVAENRALMAAQEKHILKNTGLMQQLHSQVEVHQASVKQNREQLDMLRNEIANYRAATAQITGQLHTELRQLRQQVSQAPKGVQVTLGD